MMSSSAEPLKIAVLSYEIKQSKKYLDLPQDLIAKRPGKGQNSSAWFSFDKNFYYPLAIVKQKAFEGSITKENRVKVPNCKMKLEFEMLDANYESAEVIAAPYVKDGNFWFESITAHSAGRARLSFSIVNRPDIQPLSVDINISKLPKTDSLDETLEEGAVSKSPQRSKKRSSDEAAVIDPLVASSKPNKKKRDISTDTEVVDPLKDAAKQSSRKRKAAVTPDEEDDNDKEEETPQPRSSRARQSVQPAITAASNDEDQEELSEDESQQVDAAANAKRDARLEKKRNYSQKKRAEQREEDQVKHASRKRVQVESEPDDDNADQQDALTKSRPTRSSAAKNKVSLIPVPVVSDEAAAELERDERREKDRLRLEPRKFQRQLEKQQEAEQLERQREARREKDRLVKESRQKQEALEQSQCADQIAHENQPTTAEAALLQRAQNYFDYKLSHVPLIVPLPLKYRLEPPESVQTMPVPSPVMQLTLPGSLVMALQHDRTALAPLLSAYLRSYGMNADDDNSKELKALLSPGSWFTRANTPTVSELFTKLEMRCVSQANAKKTIDNLMVLFEERLADYVLYPEEKEALTPMLLYLKQERRLLSSTFGAHYFLRFLLYVASVANYPEGESASTTGRIKGVLFDTEKVLEEGLKLLEYYGIIYLP